ncbi:MAG: glycosyltransferase family 4 protein [Gammaproteobacteria bacterium]|jgi:colanic acid biosynthesis glycosyl transferase WcaI
MSQGTVWVASELYYPDEQATGVFMTGIAEGLAARGLEVKALAAQPNSGKVASHEFLNGVEVFRSWSTSFSKDFVPGRIINVLTTSFSMLFSALWRIRKNDVVLVVTNPPTLPYMIMLVCKIKRAKCIVRVDDVFPDNMHACNYYSNQSFIYKFFDWLTAWLYSNVDVLVVIGRCQEVLVQTKTDNISEIRVITNWADVDDIGPDPEAGKQFLAELGLEGKLVLQWAGNMGFPHDVETILEAIEKLSVHEDVHFLIIGSGARRPWMEEQVKKKGLRNVTFLGLLPRSQQQAFLNGCDIGLSSLVDGYWGIAVPSRSYNILCAGKPILTVAQADGEISRLIVDKSVGWVVPPGDSDKFVEVVTGVLNDRSQLVEMGRRGRAVAEQEYSAAYIIDRYAELLEEQLST